MSQISQIVRAIAANPSNSVPADIPRLLFSEDISRITGLSVTTIRHYTGNAEKFGHLLPKWFKLPGARRLAWLEADVLAHIQLAQAAPSLPKRRRGRPTKAEQLVNQKFNGHKQADVK
jgi:predicted DNA-binding transcriptional regulator AlpA